MARHKKVRNHTNSYNKLSGCIKSIKNEYEPIIISTDLAQDSILLKELDIKTFIHPFCEAKRLNSKKNIDSLLFSYQLKKEEINLLRKKYESSQENLITLENKDFIEKIFTQGKLLEGKKL